MPGKVIRLCDYERRSKNPDAVQRDPAETAAIIILPVIRKGDPMFDTLVDYMPLTAGAKAALRRQR